MSGAYKQYDSRGNEIVHYESPAKGSGSRRALAELEARLPAVAEAGQFASVNRSGEVKKIEDEFMLEGTIDVIASPILRANKMVAIYGLGAQLSTMYYMEKVTHTWSKSSGYTMQMEVKTDKFGLQTYQPSPASGNGKMPVETPSTGQQYVIKQGDTLWDISRKYYGAGSKWRRIWDANRDILMNRDKRNSGDAGHWIHPGTKITIP